MRYKCGQHSRPKSQPNNKHIAMRYPQKQNDNYWDYLSSDHRRTLECVICPRQSLCMWEQDNNQH